MMRDAILNFPKQFRYRPKIVRQGRIRLGRKGGKFVVAGMGGSHLAADILKSLRPELDMTIWSDYGLPFDLSWSPTTLPRPGEGHEVGRGRILVIASSYSGNTEETLDACEQARKGGFAVVVVASGGKLIELAKRHQLPYIQLPQAVDEPRMASGLSFKALLKLTKQNDILKESALLAKVLKPQEVEVAGKLLAQNLKGKVPVMYASLRNQCIAYNWKIKFNETGKIPAFYNVFPELNHNEINGFSAEGGPASGGDIHSSKNLSDKFHFIFLKDSEDHSKNQKRMEVTAKLYQDRGLPTEIIELSGGSRLERIFKCLLLADWTALYTAQNYGFKPEGQPMVEEFKKLIQ